MHWIVGGLLIFGFASPSAVVGVPYAIGTQGILVGVVLCILYTICCAFGSVLLLELAHSYKNIHEFKDVGREVLGPKGAIFATVIQNGNFLLFLPVALDLIASAAQGFIDPSHSKCTDYFILCIAGIGLFTTQIRKLTNADIFSMMSLPCVFAIAFIMIYQTSSTENADKETAYLIGNPDSPGTADGFVKALLGVTTANWSYVPAFLIIELKDAIPNQSDMRKAIYLSAILNMILYISVGVTVVVNWGWNLTDPITISSAWDSHSKASIALSVLMFISNLISYCLDSVPVTRKFVNWIDPSFDVDDWSLQACLQFFFYSLFPWLFGLVVVLIAPNVFLLLAFVTAFTVPWVTMIFPSLCYIVHSKQVSSTEDKKLGGVFSPLVSDETGMTHVDSLVDREYDDQWKVSAAYGVLALGLITFLICLGAALGEAILPDLRGDSIIGCDGWYILRERVHH